MSITTVSAGIQHGHAESRGTKVPPREPFAKQVVDSAHEGRIDAHGIDPRFAASVRTERATPSATLEQGDVARATSSALGGLVELRYLGQGRFERIHAPTAFGLLPIAAELDHVAEPQPSPSLIATQERSVDSTDVANIVLDLQSNARVAVHAPLLSPDAPAPWPRVEQDEAFRALYGTGTPTDDRRRDVVDVSDLVRDAERGGRSLEALAALLEGTVADQASALESNARSPEREQAADAPPSSADLPSFEPLASLPADRMADAPAADAYCFGRLPVIVADQLIELDFLVLRQRQSTSPQTTRRRLVMTLRTEALGVVEVTAQSLGAHLDVSIVAQSAGTAASLATHAREVKDLLGRLGWQTAGVSYRTSIVANRREHASDAATMPTGQLDITV